MLRPTILALALAAACSNQKAPESRADPSVIDVPAVRQASGPRVTGEGFVVDIEVPDKAVIGVPVTARVELHPTAGYHVNKDFPAKLEVQPVEGVDLPKTAFKKADARRLDEAGAVFDVQFTPRTTGRKNFKATFSFAVCTPQNCTPSRESLAWSVNVE